MGTLRRAAFFNPYRRVAPQESRCFLPESLEPSFPHPLSVLPTRIVGVPSLPHFKVAVVTGLKLHALLTFLLEVPQLVEREIGRKPHLASYARHFPRTFMSTASPNDVSDEPIYTAPRLRGHRELRLLRS